MESKTTEKLSEIIKDVDPTLKLKIPVNQFLFLLAVIVRLENIMSEGAAQKLAKEVVDE